MPPTLLPLLLLTLPFTLPLQCNPKLCLSLCCSSSDTCATSETDCLFSACVDEQCLNECCYNGKCGTVEQCKPSQIVAILVLSLLMGLCTFICCIVCICAIYDRQKKRRINLQNIMNGIINNQEIDNNAEIIISGEGIIMENQFRQHKKIPLEEIQIGVTQTKETVPPLQQEDNQFKKFKVTIGDKNNKINSTNQILKKGLPIEQQDSNTNWVHITEGFQQDFCPVESESSYLNNSDLNIRNSQESNKIKEFQDICQRITTYNKSAVKECNSNSDEIELKSQSKQSIQKYRKQLRQWNNDLYTTEHSNSNIFLPKNQIKSIRKNNNQITSLSTRGTNSMSLVETRVRQEELYLQQQQQQQNMHQGYLSQEEIQEVGERDKAYLSFSSEEEEK